jgi:hypothetical protein
MEVNNKRTEAAIKMEILALNKLIDKRYKWLGNDKNKSRSTYSAVSKDTKELEAKLSDLKNELEIKKTKENAKS